MTQFGNLVQFGAVVASAQIKVASYVFLRMLPLGYKFLPKILTSYAVFTAGLLLHLRFQRRTAAAFVLDGIVNTLILLFIADFLYRGHFLHPANDLSFSRLGFVDETNSHIVIRHPNASNYTLTYVSHDGKASVEAFITASEDYTSSVVLTGLTPSTRYNYTTSLGHSGTFRTSSTPQKRFSFISSSCWNPFYPYDPLSHALSIPGLRYLNDYVEDKMDHDPDFVFLLGDFYYSDLPIQLAPYTREYYTKLFRQVYASPDWTYKLRNIPWLHMFDDHELVNDFYPQMVEGGDMYNKAMDPFVSYQHRANPSSKDTSKFYYTFRRGDASFFVLDTRSYRDVPPPKHGENGGLGTRSMLGKQQLEELEEWIRKEKGWKVIVSGVPFTRNWSEGGDEMDSWAGYLEERQHIFELLWKYGGGVVISGDRHEHATVKFPPPALSGYPEEHTVIEFSTSPLSFFFQPVIREYVTHEPTDITIHHEYYGSSKFGVFEFDSVSEQKWFIKFKLVVDGKEKWDYIHTWHRT
ncbi:hypothetical protein D9758_008844 [Tetrapyrgos nigripes]|uniref:PhoD-like phosphatase metallophosphatase domain-containing protein n=1 Tax=Tetrapyrgos nigripes TaxID=182062 RepID=A0A8H5CLY1_9AGAR|nr:hypothetical protein D9758_008844 [Tetrapyrgos nigripes]